VPNDVLLGTITSEGGNRMPAYKYVIVGGGMTADAAVRGIRAVDSDGSIAMISAEPHPPYSRPPLSKSLWKGDPLESIWRSTPTESVTMLLSTTIRRIDPSSHLIIDEGGRSYQYGRLLLATGGAVRKLPGAADGIIYFRTLDDYRRLRELADRDARVVVIGGGFIGSEVAAALRMHGSHVTMIFPEYAIGSRLFSPPLASFINAFYADHGIHLLPATTIGGIDRHNGTYTIDTDTHGTLEAEIVVAGLGVRPEVSLARDAGIEVGDGIRVDEQMKTSAPDVYAAGDVASFFNPLLSKYIRVEHEDNALSMGEAAGRSMAGESVRYEHLPFFYSDLFDLGYEAVGEINAQMTIVEDWTERFRKGVIYYMADSRVRGVLLWNVWGKVDEARRLISRHEPVAPQALQGTLRD
jgi:3-phenylpropionate/trans-cinnamate dioxygenase ferredoxin reductase component